LLIEFEGGSAESKRGLPLVRTIPDLSPCLLEGPNGIGKTLAVNLLRLVCGQQPWLGEPALWQSLRDALASTEIRIRVTGLRCGQAVDATLDPSGWPAEPRAEIGDWLGTVKLGGDLATPDEISRVLTVERFGGNEDLQRVMRLELQRTGAHLDATSQALEEQVASTLDQLDAITEVLGPAEPAVRAGLQRQLAAKHEEIAQAEKHLAEGRAARELAGEGLRLRGRLEEFDAKPEALRLELEGQQSKLQELQTERDSLDEEIDDLLTHLKPRGDLEDALSAAQKLLTQRQKRLDRQRAALDSVTQLFGGGDHPEREDLDEEIERVRELIEEDRRALLTIDRSGRVREAIDEVLPSLTAAERDGVGDEAIAEIADSSLSVSQLQAGLAKRDTALREMPLDESAAQVRDQLEGRIARHDLLSKVAAAQRDVARGEELVSEADDGVRQARSSIQVASEALDAYDALVARREALQGDLAEILGAVARLRGNLGLPATESKEDLERETARIAAELGVQTDELEVTWAALDADLSSSEAALLVARQEATSLQTVASQWPGESSSGVASALSCKTT